MESISFQLPTQHSPGEDDFDTRPTAVADWVAQLPMGNIGEAARQVYMAIKQSNSLSIPPGDRLAMLEHLAEPLAIILAALRRHYADSHFPLPVRSQRTAEFSRELLRQVVMGYQAVLDGEEQRSWLFRLGHHRMWRLSVHRLLHYLGELLCSVRMVHRPYPAGVWLAVHKLYREVLQHGRSLERIALPWKGGVSESLEDAYKSLLLLTLLEPHLFTRVQLESVTALMPLWLKHVQLLPPEQLGAETGGYCIRLDHDTPYTVSSELCSGGATDSSQTLHLDLAQLEQLILTVLSREGESLSLPGASQRLSRETLETLSQCWRVPRSERDERYRSDRPLQVALGLSAIFNLLRGQEAAQQAGITDQQMGDDLEPLLPSDSGSKRKPLRKEQGAVWDVIFAGTDVIPNAWAVDHEEREYRFISAHELDYNARGHCLEFRREDVALLDVGELVAITDEEGKLQLSSVRWLQDREDVILVGLMRLATELEPVLVVVEKTESSQQETALGCLLAIGDDGRPQLFMPHLPSQREHDFRLVVERKKIPLILQERVALSPLFQACHFLVADRDGQTLLAEADSMELLNRTLMDIVHNQAVPDHPRAADDFSDLWSGL